MKHLFLFLIFLTFFNIKGQNLVNNPSFELYSVCPYIDHSFTTLNWISPANQLGTPNTCNSCSSFYANTVPNNGNGYQEPYDGNGYISIFMYQPDFGEIREYIQTQLISPLIANQDYYISFFVSLAESSRKAVNNIGAAITNNAISGDGTYHHISVIPQINSNQILSDQNGWSEVSGIYHASGGEKFLTIGNFYDDNQTSVLTLSEFGSNYSFYYIDMVSVTSTNLQNDEFSDLNNLGVYPNPFSNQLHFKIQNTYNIKSIEIFSLTGLVYKSEQISDSIDLSCLQNGLYYIVFTDLNNEKIFKRIVKK